jgi:hypothetical protein
MFPEILLFCFTYFQKYIFYKIISPIMRYYSSNCHLNINIRILQSVCGLLFNHSFNPQQFPRTVKAFQWFFLYLHSQSEQIC